MKWHKVSLAAGGMLLVVTHYIEIVKVVTRMLPKKQKNKSESENQKENPCVRTAHYKLQITPAAQQRPTR